MPPEYSSGNAASTLHVGGTAAIDGIAAFHLFGH